MERLITLLMQGPKLENLQFFPGEDLVTIEDFCAEAHAAFVQVNSGLSAASRGFTENLTRVSVESFLS